MLTLLLDAEAALDGGSEAVHGLPRAADPLADREDRAPEGPHAAPGGAARPLPPPRAWVGGARRRPPRARVGFNGVRRDGSDGEGRGEEPGRQWLRQRRSGDCWGKEATRPMVLG